MFSGEIKSCRLEIPKVRESVCVRGLLAQLYSNITGMHSMYSSCNLVTPLLFSYLLSLVYFIDNIHSNISHECVFLVLHK